MTILSMITLSAMNIERYHCIVHPFVHIAKVTRKIIFRFCFSFRNNHQFLLTFSFQSKYIYFCSIRVCSSSFIHDICLHKDLFCMCFIVENGSFEWTFFRNCVSQQSQSTFRMNCIIVFEIKVYHKCVYITCMQFNHAILIYGYIM